MCTHLTTNRIHLIDRAGLRCAAQGQTYWKQVRFFWVLGLLAGMVIEPLTSAAEIADALTRLTNTQKVRVASNGIESSYCFLSCVLLLAYGWSVKYKKTRFYLITFANIDGDVRACCRDA